MPRLRVCVNCIHAVEYGKPGFVFPVETKPVDTDTVLCNLRTLNGKPEMLNKYSLNGQMTCDQFEEWKP